MNYTISVHSLFSITMKGAIILQSGTTRHSLYIRELHDLLTKNRVMSLPQTPSFQHNQLSLIKKLSRYTRPSHERK